MRIIITIIIIDTSQIVQKKKKEAGLVLGCSSERVSFRWMARAVVHLVALLTNSTFFGSKGIMIVLDLDPLMHSTSRFRFW